MVIVHHSATAIIQYAKIARKHHLHSVCLDSLSKIHSILSVPVLDCFQGIRQQVGEDTGQGVVILADHFCYCEMLSTVAYVYLSILVQDLTSIRPSGHMQALPSTLTPKSYAMFVYTCVVDIVELPSGFNPHPVPSLNL